MLQLDDYLICYLAVEPLLYQQTASVTAGFTENKGEGSRDKDRDQSGDEDRQGQAWGEMGEANRSEVMPKSCHTGSALLVLDSTSMCNVTSMAA